MCLAFTLYLRARPQQEHRVFALASKHVLVPSTSANSSVHTLARSSVYIFFLYLDAFKEYIFLFIEIRITKFTYRTKQIILRRYDLLFLVISSFGDYSLVIRKYTIRSLTRDIHIY